MNNLNVLLGIALILGCLHTTYAVRCYDCSGSCSNPTPVTCRGDQQYCYIAYGGVMKAGCAVSCTPGTQTSCCNGDLCNDPRRRQFQCYSCADCRYGRSIETCNNQQPFCYKQRIGNTFRKGCSATCIPGRDVSCCGRSLCNGATSINDSHILKATILVLSSFLYYFH